MVRSRATIDLTKKYQLLEILLMKEQSSCVMRKTSTKRLVSSQTWIASEVAP